MIKSLKLSTFSFWKLICLSYLYKSNTDAAKGQEIASNSTNFLKARAEIGTWIFIFFEELKTKKNSSEIY